MAKNQVLDLIERAIGTPDAEPLHACGDDCRQCGCVQHGQPQRVVRSFRINTKILRQHRPPRHLLMAKPSPA